MLFRSPEDTLSQIYFILHFFLNIIFHYGLSQDIEYTLGPCCLSILNVKACIYLPTPKLPVHFLSSPFESGKSILYV